MATREQWYWEADGEAQGPYDSREKAIGAAMNYLRKQGRGDFEAIMDSVVEILEQSDIRVGRLMPPGTLS